MRLKLGACTGATTTSGEDILVGQNIISDGEYYYCNSYLQAVPYGDGKAIKLPDLVGRSKFTEVAELPEGYKQIGEICPCRGGGKKAVAGFAIDEERLNAAKEMFKEALEEVKEKTLKEEMPPEVPEEEIEVVEEQVNHPSHYNSYGIETITMMVKIWGAEKVADWCEITAFKYRMRMGMKQGNPVEQDLAKEKFYLDYAKKLRA